MKRSSNYYRGTAANVSAVQTGSSLIYLDNAATTFPKPSEVTEAVMKAINEYGGNPGRGSHVLARRASDKINEARELAANIFGSSKPENVIFTHNATEALNMAIFSAARNGGHILISDIEHNSVYRPVAALASEGKNTFDMYSSVGNSEDILHSIESKIRKDTVLVVACHKSNICPIELPINSIGSLCRSKGIKFVVDASQSAGSSEVNINKCKAWAVCAPGHKGLYGPQGSGLLVLGDEVSASDVSPFYFGGSGAASSEKEMPSVLPHRMEAGTLPTPAIAGLCEGMKYVMSRGAENIGAHENSLVNMTRNALSGFRRVKIYLPSDSRSSILLFNIEGIACRDVAEHLDKHGICVRSGLHCAPLAHRRLGTFGSGGVRVSFGAFSTQNDVERLYNAVRSVAAR